MRVLITGSLGTLGVPLTFELSERGHAVFGCDLAHTAQEVETYMRADVSKYRQLQRVFEEYQPEAVFHLAAEFGRHNGEDYYEDVFLSNYLGTRNVLELCKRHGSKLIFASSSEIYGECGEEFLSEELSERMVLNQPNEYALSKASNEAQVRLFSAKHDLEAVRLRFFNVYGPGEHYHPYRSVIALFCHRAIHGIPWTVYRGYYRTFMYVDDFIPTLANALDKGKPGEVYNIGGEDYRSIEELSALVLDETRADPDLVTYLDQDPENVLSKRPDNTKARAVLGHDPKVTINEGVPATIDWMLGRVPASF
jgi:dTDP-glucose 4,6-dehydratase